MSDLITLKKVSYFPECVADFSKKIKRVRLVN